MHRSGTSFVASLLHAAGLDMGSRLMPAARSNERGHYENMDFVEFHMRELRMNGYDDSGWAAQESLKLSEEAASEAHNIIESNARASAWGWKDPRTTLFLDFWSSVVSDANYLYIYREPSEVIDSLYRRGDESIQLSPELAARAFLTHNEMMLRHARKHRAHSVIANVSAIARNPEQFLTTVAEKFGLDIDAHANSPFEGGLMRNIDPDAPRATLLRHLVPEIELLYSSLEQEADIPSGADESKRILVRKAKDAFFHDWLDSAREDLASIAKAELDELQSSNTKRGEHLEEAERLLAAERATHEALEQRHEQTTRERDAERTSREGLEQRLEQTTQELTRQTEASIAAARAESEMLTYLIATVQSSSFWKLKRAINRVRRALHLDRK
jgi:O-antigen biosynthesis protein